MKPSLPEARTYRLLGCLALAHALALFGMLFLCYSVHWQIREQLLRCWVGLTTLWLFWPVVLILHRGRSWQRCLVFLSLSTVFFLPSLPSYAFREAPSAFDLPFGVALEPISISQYCRAYWAGWTEAKRDIAAGILAREVYGFGGGGPTVDALRKRYQIETRPTAGCMVDARIVGHAAGYNATSQAEFNRRFGRGSIAKTEAQSGLELLNHGSDYPNHTRELARRFSKSSPESKIALESVEVALLKGGGLLKDVDQDQLKMLVWKIEESLKNEVVENLSSSRFGVTANFAADQWAEYEVTGSLTSPGQIYDSIRQKLPRIRWSRLDGDALSVRLTFTVQPPPT